MSEPLSANDFPLKEARGLVKDLMKPNETIYWADYLFHITLGWVGFWQATINPYFTPIWWGGFIIGALALYRAVIFIHELSHLKKGTFKLFRFVWNLTVGFALMVPSFTYHGVHNDHHARDVYGTKEDGEYLPFGAEAPWKIVGYLFLIFIIPPVFIVRFLILTPLGIIIPPLRRLVWERLSSLTIDFDFKRNPLNRGDDPTSYLQELMASVYCWAGAYLLYTGLLPEQFLVMWYATTVLAFFLNSLRTLCAHAYRNPITGPTMTLSEQFLDSVNVPGNLFTTLWAPVGLRFHATHHLFPAMPYHSLGTAHKRLIAELSDNTIYLQASRSSMWNALTRLWADSKASQAK